MTEYNFQIDSAAVSDRGLSEKRPQNEDSFLEITERGIFAVADGVGGAQAGEVASSMAMEILGEAFVNTRANSDAEEVMKIAIQHANSSIYQMSHDLSQLSTMATTIVALQIAGNIATIAHVGDSRLYRLDGNGNLYRETQDHSVVEEEVRAGRMTPQQAANHPSRNVISRALGAEQTVEIDVKTIMFEPQSSFLICSDGITRHLDDFEIRQLLRLGGTPAEICAEMKKLCFERGAEDNLTAVIVRVSPAVAPEFAEKTVPAAMESEEATVAAARQTEIPAPVLNDSFVDETEIPTQNLVMPQTNESKIPTGEYPTEQPPENSAAAEVEFVPETTEIPQQPAPPEVQSVETREREVLSYHESEKSGTGFFGKLLRSLLLLLIGAGLGAGAYYYWQSQNKQPEVPPQMPTSVDQPKTAISIFEEGRRTADGSPQKYIEAHKSETKNAEQYYLLGRAALLIHDFAEAKKYFTEAKNHLEEIGKENRQVLENDINVGLMIAENVWIQSEFKKVIPNKVNNSASTNTNTNSATETN